MDLVYNSKLGPQWQSRDQVLKFLNSKWRTAAMFKNIRKVITRLPIDRLRPTWVVTSHHVPDMSLTIWLSWRRPLPSNGALNILQLWASEGRMREPILIKFGRLQHVKTRTTVTWLNIKIFKIQNGGRPPCWKIFEMPYLAYQWTDGDKTWVVTSHHAPDMSAVMRLPWQRPKQRIVHSAVMGVWSANAWTNFDEIWCTTAN